MSGLYDAEVVTGPASTQDQIPVGRRARVPMLEEFLITHRNKLIDRTRAKVALRSAPRPTEEELTNGVPMFLTQLGEALQLEGSSSKADLQIVESAARYGHEMLNHGFTVGQVVHDYGDVCQAVTELAVEVHAPIPTEEFNTLNRCLDNAIAGAVTEYGRQQEQKFSRQATERLGVLAHELGSLVSGAMLTFEALKTGRVGIGGSTARLLESSLHDLRDLIHRSLSEVRLESGSTNKEPILVKEFMDDAEVGAAIDAKNRAVHLTVAPIDADLMVHADRQLLTSAVGNLLRNAFRFTRPQGQVVVNTYGTTERVRIEFEDECGGLPPGKAEEIFLPFKKRGHDRPGMGLGLAISRRAIEENGGLLSVRDVPRKGCVFVIDLPRVPPIPQGILEHGTCVNAPEPPSPRP
jgi:signal transduction histidine kinase